MLKNIIRSLRPKQWTKNLCIFAGLIFSQNCHNISLVFQAVQACLVFCLLSGCVYILNDISDREKDRAHPVKSLRPLASGALSVGQAVSAALLLGIASLVYAALLGVQFLIVAAAYLCLHVAYSLFLKNIVILDIIVVAAGFVLRVVAGAVVIQVEISSWLVVCTLFLALFLVLCKRRRELMLVEKTDQGRRKSLNEYSTALLDQMISIVTASTVVSYALYTMSPETIAKAGTRNLIYTIPFVLYGIFRYLYLVYRREGGDNPEQILITDMPLILTILLWLCTTGVLLYVF